MSVNQITFFAVDNGDAVLLEAHGRTVMTDINYRGACADEEDETNDFAPTIRSACNDDSLDIFVLTHPDEDHLRGFGEVFHLGAPSERDNDPDDGDVKLIVNEIWCSPYGANPNYKTDASRPFLNEIARRKRLQGSTDSELDGNRLKVLSASDRKSTKICDGLEWRLLAPSPDEANIPIAIGDEPKNSSNPSSLVIQWAVTVGGTTSKVLLAGDATVEIWERLNDEADANALCWNVLLAPHHCSRHSMGRGENEEFEWSENAIAALNNPTGTSPHVVCSARKFREGQTPPNPEARNKYYEFLAKGRTIDAGVTSRLLLTAGKGNSEAADVVFRFKASGLTRSIAGTGAAAAGEDPASAGGGGYGWRRF